MSIAYWRTYFRFTQAKFIILLLEQAEIKRRIVYQW